MPNLTAPHTRILERCRQNPKNGPSAASGKACAVCVATKGRQTHHGTHTGSPTLCVRESFGNECAAAGASLNRGEGGGQGRPL